MLSDELILWIRNKVETKYNRADLDISIQLLDYYLTLCKDPQEELRAMQQMQEAPDSEKRYLIKDSFSDVETFMKKLCALVRPRLMDNPPAPLYPAENRPEWTLGHLYKQAFQVVPMNSPLGSQGPLPNPNAPGYQYAYVKIYRFRNMKTHERDRLELSEQDILDYTVGTLVIKLDLCLRHARQLTRLYRARQIDQDNFIRRICEEYDAATGSGFSYVDIRWLRNNKPADAYSIQNIAISKDEDLRLVKFLGEAGCGKTTALRQIEITLARRQSEEPDTPIPIYIELGKLTGGNNILRNKIAEVLRLEGAEGGNLVKSLLESSMLCLLLDGFNEILDPSVKKSVAYEIDGLAGTGARIFLTDRAKARPSDLTLRHAANCYMKPMSDDVKRDFFEKNCRDQAILELILKQMEEDPVYFESINTPIKLKQLIDVTQDGGKLPQDPVRAFIRYLIRRERQDKKDENTEYLEIFLAALALLTQPRILSDEELDELDEDELEAYLESDEEGDGEPDRVEIPKLKALAQMAKYQREYGFTKADTNQCLQLAVDMGILNLEESEEEEEVVSFANRQYQDYFCFLSDRL